MANLAFYLCDQDKLVYSTDPIDSIIDSLRVRRPSQFP